LYSEFLALIKIKSDVRFSWLFKVKLFDLLIDSYNFLALLLLISESLSVAKLHPPPAPKVKSRAAAFKTIQPMSGRNSP